MSVIYAIMKRHWKQQSTNSKKFALRPISNSRWFLRYQSRTGIRLFDLVISIVCLMYTYVSLSDVSPANKQCSAAGIVWGGIVWAPLNYGWYVSHTRVHAYTWCVDEQSVTRDERQTTVSFLTACQMSRTYATQNFLNPWRAHRNAPKRFSPLETLPQVKNV